MKSWELEDWLTNEGDKVVRKASTANALAALDWRARLIYEVWLLDTERRNGGVSQYFCNRGLKQWDALSKVALPCLPSFALFANTVNSVIGRSSDPYKAVIDSGVDLDTHYDENAVGLITELQEAVRQ